MSYKSAHAKHKEVKSDHPDAIIFVRLDDDFYIAFDEDADICTDELDLGARNMREFPADFTILRMPCCAIEGHVARLIDKGHAIVMCDKRRR